MCRIFNMQNVKRYSVAKLDNILLGGKSCHICSHKHIKYLTQNDLSLNWNHKRNFAKYQKQLLWQYMAIFNTSTGTLFPEMRAIAGICAGTHASKFTIYCTHKMIVLSLFVLLLYISHKENFSLKYFSLSFIYRKFKM